MDNLKNKDKETLKEYAYENYKIDNIKDVYARYDDNLLIITNKNELYFNNHPIESEIDSIFEHNIYDYFIVTKDNIIRNLDYPESKISRYIENNKIPYKKVIHDETMLIGLTSNGEVRILVGVLTDVCIVPERLTNVSDIYFKEIDNLSIPFIIKDNKELTLFKEDIE